MEVSRINFAYCIVCRYCQSFRTPGAGASRVFWGQRQNNILVERIGWLSHWQLLARFWEELLLGHSWTWTASICCRVNIASQSSWLILPASEQSLQLSSYCSLQWGTLLKILKGLWLVYDSWMMKASLELSHTSYRMDGDDGFNPWIFSLLPHPIRNKRFE